MMTALVTGASSGIGKEFAILLAKEWKCDLFLVSNQELALEETADMLRETYGVDVRTLCIDLADHDAAESVHTATEGLDIDILINNAGMFYFEKFTSVDLERIDAMMALHMATPTRLCWLYGADMCRRRHGYILNMSSVCAWMDFPGLHLYESTKRYIYTLSRAIRHEFLPLDVSVTLVTPGAVDTPLYGLSDATRKRLVCLGISMRPEKLAEKALKAMFAKKKRCMPGLMNHLFIMLLRLLPDSLVRCVMKRLSPWRNA